MKKRTSIALALLLGWNVFAAENASAEDISKHWAYEQLTYAVEKSIVRSFARKMTLLPLELWRKCLLVSLKSS